MNEPPVRRRRTLTIVLDALGAVAIIAGIALVSHVAALVVAGVLLFVLAAALERG